MFFIESEYILEYVPHFPKKAITDFINRQLKPFKLWCTSYSISVSDTKYRVSIQCTDKSTTTNINYVNTAPFIKHFVKSSKNPITQEDVDRIYQNIAEFVRKQPSYKPGKTNTYNYTIR